MYIRTYSTYTWYVQTFALAFQGDGRERRRKNAETFTEVMSTWGGTAPEQEAAAEGRGAAGESGMLYPASHPPAESSTLVRLLQGCPCSQPPARAASPSEPLSRCPSSAGETLLRYLPCTASWLAWPGNPVPVRHSPAALLCLQVPRSCCAGAKEMTEPQRCCKKPFTLRLGSYSHRQDFN